jgi:hypothetical protein
MDVQYVCVLSVSVLSCAGRSFAAGCSPVKGVLPSFVRLKIFRLILKWEEARGPNLSREEDEE